MSQLYGYSAVPGISAAATSTERQVLWAGATWYLLKSISIKSTAVDAGNTPTTELRAGLLMGMITATKLHIQYAVNAVDGSERVEGFLWEPRNMLDQTATAAAQFGQLCVAGPVKNSMLLLLDQQARAQMHGRFIFDDDLPGNSCGWQRVVAKTEAYAVLAADNNTIFTNLGATALVAFTLPAIAKGLRYRFYSEDNDGFSVSSATADTMVAHNDVDIDTVAFSTTARNIGAGLEVFANSDATKWLCFPFTWNIADDGSTTTKATLTD